MIERRPLHQQVAAALRKRLASGEFSPGATLPSELVLQQEYGVSRATVRHALETLQREGLLQRRAGQGTYVAPSGPTPLSSTVQRPCLGLVAARLSSLFLMDMLRGVEEEAEARGYDLLVANSNHDPQQERERIERLRRRGVAGVLVEPAPGATLESYYRDLVGMAYPLVMLDRRHPEVAVDYVGVDNVKATQELVAHLIACGHQRIAYLLGQEWPTSTARERLQGYETALRRAGLSPDPALVVRPAGAPGDPFSPAVAAAAQRLLALPANQRPTAICCLNDATALEVLRVLRNEDLRVPEDMALTGFDDLPYAAHLEVPLTTVAQPRAQLGSTGARLLIDRIEGRRGAQPATVLLPTRLLLRRSSDWIVAAEQAAAETA
ncbi:MAG: substrate-binding domain-containing protein [Chloroflexi bacterium]|nr:substrate-binding domain-containing protein [Chloroflexota bacterium]